MKTYDDLVKRLTKQWDCSCMAYSSSECGCPNANWPSKSCKEAASAIEKLQRKVKRLTKERDDWNHNYIMCADAKVVYRDGPAQPSTTDNMDG